MLMLLSGLLGAAYLAWLALSSVDFLYPWLYEALEIDRHIEAFAPQNRYREGFAATSDAQRIQLFGRIVDSVNDQGRGLESLSYRPGADAAPVPLLRQPEIEHLRLVAELVTALRWAGAAALGLFIALTVAMVAAGLRPARMLPAGGIALGALVAGALAFASFDVSDAGWFERLHDWVFPPNHQWFFYYQDSLMTTLMKAPDLFGPMAAALGLTTLSIYALLLGGLQWVLHRREQVR